MYQLEETFYFYILLLIPVIILVFIYNKLWQKKIINKYFNKETFKFLSPDFSHSKSYLKTSIILFLITFLVI